MPRKIRSLYSLLFLLVSVLGVQKSAAEYLPVRPSRYCEDNADLLKPETVRQLDRALEGAEYASSNQLIVALYRSMRSSATMEDYCQRLATSWQVGRAGNENGVVLFYFKREQRFYIEVRPGLRSVLPDAEVRRIITERMIPWVKANDFDGAVLHGIAAILDDTKNAYKGDMRHAYWLHNTLPQFSRGFRDYLPTFLSYSILFYVGLGVWAALKKLTKRVVTTFSSSSVAHQEVISKSASASSRRLGAHAKGSDKKHSGFWDIALGFGVVAGLLAVLFIGVWLWHIYVQLDRKPFLIVTSAGLCFIAFLLVWFVRANWELFQDERHSSKTPPNFWQTLVAVCKLLGYIAGAVVAIIVVVALQRWLGLIGMLLGGGVFGVAGFLFSLGGGLLSGGGGSGGGSSFGGGGGASSSW